MTKKEQLLKIIESQKEDFYNDTLLKAKKDFEKSIIKGIENYDDFKDKDLDILLKEDNLLSKLMIRAICWELNMQEFSCGWQDIIGFIEDKKWEQRKKISDEEM